MTDIISMSDIARHLRDTIEGQRIRNAETQGWRRWGPYVSDRQ